MFDNTALDKITGVTYLDKIAKNRINNIVPEYIREMNNKTQWLHDAIRPYRNLLDSSAIKVLSSKRYLAYTQVPRIPILEMQKLATRQLNFNNRPTALDFMKEQSKMNRLTLAADMESSLDFVKAMASSFGAVDKKNSFFTYAESIRKSTETLREIMEASSKLGLHQISYVEKSQLENYIESTKYELDDVFQAESSKKDIEVLNEAIAILKEAREREFDKFEERILARISESIQNLFSIEAREGKLFQYKMFWISIGISIFLTFLGIYWNQIVARIDSSQQIESTEGGKIEKKLLLLGTDSYFRSEPDSCDDSKRIKEIHTGTVLVKVAEVPYWYYVLDMNSNTSGWVSKRVLVELH